MPNTLTHTSSIITHKMSRHSRSLRHFSTQVQNSSSGRPCSHSLSQVQAPCISVLRACALLQYSALFFFHGNLIGLQIPHCNSSTWYLSPHVLPNRSTPTVPSVRKLCSSSTPLVFKKIVVEVLHFLLGASANWSLIFRLPSGDMPIAVSSNLAQE